MGCELMVFDISSTTNPIYVAGRDASGDSTGTGSAITYSLTTSGNYLYLGKWGDATACSQTAGSAMGCELMVFDISSTTNPIYVAGRDASGDSTGTGNSEIRSLTISGSNLYVGRGSNTTACSQTAGSAIGCELMVFDISSTTNPIYVAGRDASGDSTGTGSRASISLTTSGSNLYVGKDADATACSQTAGSAIGCELMVFQGDISHFAGTLTGSSALNNVNLRNTTTFDANASTTNLTVMATPTVTAPQQLTVAGNFTNNGTMTMASTTYFTGASSTAMKTISGNLASTSALFQAIVNGTYWLNNDASTTDLTINTGGVLNQGARLSISGNYTNSSGTMMSYGSSTHFTGTGKTWAGTGTTTLLRTFVTGSYTGGAPATTSDFTINSGGSFTASSTLTIAGNFANSGTWTNASGTLIIVGASSSLPSTLTGSSALGDTIIRPATRGTDWSPRSASEAGSWMSVTYGKGLFVAVCFDCTNKVMTSPDGITWTPQTAVNSGWNSVTYGNGLFVAVARSGTNRVMTSPDGINWTPQSAAGASTWNSVTYGNGLFVAVADSGTYRVMTSPDGITWTGRTAATQSVWYSVTYGNGLFVAVGSQVIMTSSDGIFWTSRTIPANDNWLGITYGSGLFVAVDFAGATRSIYSSDGVIWATSSIPQANAWYSVTYGNGNFVAVACGRGGGACDNTVGGSRVMYSSDGRSWVAASSSEANSWRGVAYGNGQLVGISSDGTNRVMTSSLGSFSFLNNASTTDLTIAPNASTSLPSQLTIAGNFTSSGTTTQSSGTTTLSGTTKTLTGAGTTTFSNIETLGSYTSSHVATTTNLRVLSGGSFTKSADITVTGNMNNLGTLTATAGTTTLTGASRTLAGTLNGTSGLGNVSVTGSYTASVNASTSALTIASGGTFVAPTLLSVSSNYQNNGTFTAGTGTTTLNGSAQQIATGTMTGVSAFANLEITNTSQDGTTTQSVKFGARASTTDTLTLYASTSAAFLAGPVSTSTFQNISLQGTSGRYVSLRSATPGTQWGFAVPGTQKTVAYVSTRDSNACSGAANISAADGTSLNVANNTCWTFATTPVATIASAANQAFQVGQATTTISTITVTEHVTTPTITAANDIRIAIATSTVGMKWDTTQTTATIGGTASGKVSTTVSYEGGGSVAVVDVTSNFAAGETLTIAGLKFAQFTAVNAPLSALGIRAGGAAATTNDSNDSKTVAIAGSLAITQHTAGQVVDSFTYPSATVVPLFGFNLAPTGEYASTTAVTFSLSGTQGVVTGDLTNAKIYRDFNSNRVVDGTDTQVGGAGTPSISGQTGTITFSGTPFFATTSQDYLMVVDVANVLPGDMMTVSFSSTGLTAMGSTSLAAMALSGSASNIQHTRSGGGSASTAIGGNAPAGQGITAGGGNGGGGGLTSSSTTIGNEPGFQAPTSNGTTYNEWTTGSNAYASDDTYATAASANLRQSYGTFGFNVAPGNTVNGITVKFEASASTNAGTIQAALSWDGDTSVTAVQTTATLSTVDNVYTLGGATDTWGHSFTPTELNNTNFRLRIISQTSSNTVKVDAVQVKVDSVATGGGSGGGGGISRRPTSTGFAGARYQNNESELTRALSELVQLLRELRT